jgi:hypothetical protein
MFASDDRTADGSKSPCGPQEMLPPEIRDILNGLYATIGLALAVTWCIQDKRKR